MLCNKLGVLIDILHRSVLKSKGYIILGHSKVLDKRIAFRYSKVLNDITVVAEDVDPDDSSLVLSRIKLIGIPIENNTASYRGIYATDRFISWRNELQSCDEFYSRSTDEYMPMYPKSEVLKIMTDTDYAERHKFSALLQMDELLYIQRVVLSWLGSKDRNEGYVIADNSILNEDVVQEIIDLFDKELEKYDEYNK